MSESLWKGYYLSYSNHLTSIVVSIYHCTFVICRGTNDTTIGVWFTVEGTGGVFEATMNMTGSLAFSVYGESCDALSCVASQDRSFLPLDWETTEGETYYLYVYATSAYEKDDFSISVSGKLTGSPCKDQHLCKKLTISSCFERGTETRK